MLTTLRAHATGAAKAVESTAESTEAVLPAESTEAVLPAVSTEVADTVEAPPPPALPPTTISPYILYMTHLSF